MVGTLKGKGVGFLFVATALSISACAMREPMGDRQARSASAKGTEVKDVETLMDNLKYHDNKAVSVKGEVRRKIDQSSFVLEGGGLVNDEIIVVKGPNLSDSKFGQAQEKSDVRVVGTVRAVPIEGLRKSVTWNPDPKIAEDLAGAAAFLVAEDVIPLAAR